MTDNAEAFYCPICERLAWNRETHAHDQDMRLLADQAANAAADADDIRADLVLAIHAIPAADRGADRGDPRIVAAAILAQFDVTYR